MGLNEIKLGVPVPYPGDCILRHLVGFRKAREVTDIGDFYSPEELIQIGMVDKVLPQNQLLEESITYIKTIGSSSPSSFRIIKQNRIEIVKDFIRRNLKERERLFIDAWYSEKTREYLKEAMKKF
jgi:enoyl-CoA hydratase/carnithine racemase